MWRVSGVGRGGRARTTARIRYWAPFDEAAWGENGRADAPSFADAVDRITELLGGDSASSLAAGIGVPGLDLLWSPHADISEAHAELLRAAATDERLIQGKTATSVPVRIIDLVRSQKHTRALLASIALLVQATNKEDPRVAMPMALREGLVGEGLADAYFTAEGWTAVAGIGAFYRSDARTFGARLVHGSGLDHLFRREQGGRTEYVVAETKVCKSDTPLHAHLRRQFAEERLRAASAETRSAPALSAPWITDRLHRAYVRGLLPRDDYEGATDAVVRGDLRRVVVLVSCTDYDRPSREHVPDPDLLTTAGVPPQRLADEVVTLRVPKPILTSLVADISSSRARGIAAIASDSRGSDAEARDG
jgi:hypothetical protein